MVTVQSVEKQLKKLKFNLHSWGRAEVSELPNILMPGEQIYECVNGMYEGGFALLVATDARVLLVDKKPLNYLTVEDLRFDMINELDYSHRMIGAQINICAGSKNLKFKSYNQKRLRKLLTHVQHQMAEIKKLQSNGQQDQKQHLEQINQQLQAYLIAQHQQHQVLTDELTRTRPNSQASVPLALKPSPELADFLFAQSLLKQYREQEASLPKESASAVLESGETPLTAATIDNPTAAAAADPIEPESKTQPSTSPLMADLYAEGMKEIYGRRPKDEKPVTAATVMPHNPLEINPLSVAYSKLPMVLRNRKFGHPSLRTHSQQLPVTQRPSTAQ
jgi:hypothetical protein